MQALRKKYALQNGFGNMLFTVVEGVANGGSFIALKGRGDYIDTCESTPSRFYPLQLDADNTIDLDTNRAILNGTTIPTRASGAPYTKNATPVRLSFRSTYCIKYKRAQIYIDGILVQDWRAAMRNGKEGMYDIIGKTFVSG